MSPTTSLYRHFRSTGGRLSAEEVTEGIVAFIVAGFKGHIDRAGPTQ